MLRLFAGLLLAGVLAAAGCTATTAPAVNTLEPKSPDFLFDADRPPTAKTLYALADIMAAQGRDREAERLLERIIEDFPKFLPAYSRLAELQMRARRFPDAAHTLSTGLKVSPGDPVLLNNLGMCRLLQKDYAAALDAFTRASQAAPDNLRYRSNRATALVLLGRREEALALYEQILPKEEAMENVQILDSIR